MLIQPKQIHNVRVILRIVIGKVIRSTITI